MNNAEYLTKEREFELFSKGDVKSRDIIFRSYYRLVHSRARIFFKKNTDMSLDDLIQEGSLGLIKAINYFDPEKGCQLGSYAVHFIDMYIRNYIYNDVFIVKMSCGNKGKLLFYNYRKIKKEIEDFGFLHGYIITNHQIHQVILHTIDCSIKDIIDYENITNSKYISGDAPLVSNSNMTLLEKIEDTTPNAEDIIFKQQRKIKIKKIVDAALNKLDDRQKSIIKNRLINNNSPNTLAELSKMYGISRERVRQIERVAFEKISTYIKRNNSKAIQLL